MKNGFHKAPKKAPAKKALRRRLAKGPETLNERSLKGVSLDILKSTLRPVSDATVYPSTSRMPRLDELENASGNGSILSGLVSDDPSDDDV